MNIETVPLGTHVRVIGGFAFPSENYSDEGIPVIRISDIQDGLVSAKKAARIPEDMAGKGWNYQVEPGDILIAMSGATTGKIGVVADDFDGPFLQNQRVGNFRIADSKKVDKVYLRHYLNSPSYQKQLRNLMAGAAQPNISSKQLESIEIPLPPLPEQKRISAILDKADSIRRKRQGAVRLTEELMLSVFLEMFGDPVTNPKGWHKKRLGEIVGSPLQNGAYYPSDLYSNDNSEGVEMVHMSDAFYGTVKRGTLKRVRASEKDIEKYCLSDADILVARRSLNYEGSVKPCLIPKGGDRLIFESSLIRINPDSNKLLPIYLYYFLNDTKAKSKYVLPYVTKSTISGINQKNLERVEIVVPDLGTQKEFERFVNKMESLTVRALQHLNNTDILCDSLQQRAFKGEM